MKIKFVSLVAAVSLVFTGYALKASSRLTETDTSLVRQQFNFLESFELKGKKVVIFGCGHGNQNEGGSEHDQGNHAHDGVICISNSPESRADYQTTRHF
jgi:hypothetical protein